MLAWSPFFLCVCGYYARLYIPQWVEQHFLGHMMLLQYNVCSFPPVMSSILNLIRPLTTILVFFITVADSISTMKTNSDSTSPH